MLKISLISLFVAIMTTFTIAASYMPVPPQVEGSRSAMLVAELD